MFSLDLGTLVVHLRAEATAFNSLFMDVERRLNNTANRMAMAGAAMSAALTIPITKAYKNVTREFALFDNEINKTMAVLGTTSNQIRSQFEQIAYDVSKDMPIATTKVAEGLHHLAQAGLSAAQSVKLMPEIAKFATAGMFNLETATELLIQSQKALGMSSENADQNLISLTRVADNLTGASIKTTASIHDFSTALSNYAGQALRLVNKDVEEGVSVLMAFAQQGIKGEDAGYRMSMMLRDLQKAAVSSGRAWEKLNVDVFDANGKMRNMGDIIIDLERVMAGWSDEQKRVGFTMLGFQDRSLMATMAILGYGKQIKQWQAELKEMGGVNDRVAKQMAESWKNQMQILWNTLSPLRIEIGKIVAGELSKLDTIVKIVVAGWTAMDDELKKSVVLYGMLAAAIGPAVLALSLMIKVMTLAIATAHGMVAAMFGWFGVALLVGAYAYVLRAAWNQNVTAIKDRLQDFWDSFKKGFEWLSNVAVGPFLKNLVAAFGSAFQTIRDGWSDFIADLSSSVLASMAAIQTMAQSIKHAWTRATLGDLWTELKIGYQESKTAFAKEFTSVFENVKPSTDAMNKWVKEELKIAGVYFSAYGEGIVEQWENLLTAVKVQFGKDFSSVVDVMKEKFPEAAEAITQALEQMNKKATESVQHFKFVDDLLEGILPKLEEMSIGPKIPVGYDVAEAPYVFNHVNLEKTNEMIGKAEEIINTLYSGMKDVGESYWRYQERRMQKSIKDWREYSDVIADNMEMEKSEVEGLIDAYEKYQKVLMERQKAISGTDFFAGMQASFDEMEENLGELGQLGYDIGEELIDGIGSAIGELIKQSDDLGESFRNLGVELAALAAEWATKKLVLEGLEFATNVAGAWAGSSGGAKVNSNHPAGFNTMHTGGIVGKNLTSFRFADPSIFEGAVRAHSGLLPGERPIIATDDEGVFTQDQMKALGGSRKDRDIAELIKQLMDKKTNSVVAFYDDRKSMARYMNSQKGQKQLIQLSRRNRAEISGG